MKIITSNKPFVTIGLIALFIVTITTCNAFVVYDPTNWVETSATAASNATMLVKETEMLEIQIESMKHLGTFHYQDMAKIIQDIEKITKQGQALSYAMGDLDTQFANHYPNYNNHGKLPAYKQAYTAWDETSLQTFQNTLQAIGLTSQDVKHQQVLLEKLKEQSTSEQGQTRLLQIGHALAINTNQHLMTLHNIISAQTNAQTAYMSHKVAKATYEEASMDRIMANAAADAPKEVGKSYGKMVFNSGHAH